MQLFEDQPQLPEGLWLVKWIDRFQLGHDSESPKVHCEFQKLPYETIDEVLRLGSGDIAELLGTKPGAELQPALPMISRSLQAAWIQMIHVGDVMTGAAGPVGRLPGSTRSVLLDRNSKMDDLRIGSDGEAPAGWKGPTFKVLNRFEYQPGGIPGIQGSRCLVFRHRDTEYILPKMVIFRAFYGLSSRLINALCSGPWPEEASKLISFKHYDSGISTGQHEGAWKIVLQRGVSPQMAAPLALLWFDEVARKHAESLYTDSLLQNDGRRGADGRSWYASANIPHRFDTLPFRMNVTGFSLRAFIPSRPRESRERFLVSAINGSSWSLPDQLIEWELDNSNRQGEEQHPAKSDRPYRRGKPPVEGDPNAIGTSIEDPNTTDSLNTFVGASFEYLSEPKLRRQQKLSSQVFPPEPPSAGDGPASLVSAGDAGRAGASPAPAEVLARLRARSLQFEFLIRALEELQKHEVIHSFEAVAPNQPRLGLTRNGLPCWSLLAARDREAGRTPKWGWEVVHERSSAEGSEVSAWGRHPRCVLILRVQLAGKHLVLLEIEPRPNESAYCILAFEQDQALDGWIIPPALDAIRQHEGRFQDAGLSASFATMTSNRVSAIRHYYSYEDVTGKKAGPATGLRADILGRALLGALVRRSSERPPAAVEAVR